MEQFELRFIVFGSDLASIRTCAKTLFEAPLPGKVSLRQEEKFLLGTVTIEYPSAASSDWQVALTSNLLTEIQFQERVEAVLNKLDLPYCVFEGTEIGHDSRFDEMAQALGSELLFQSIWQSVQVGRDCARHLPSLTQDGGLGHVLSFAKKALAQQVWDDLASGKAQLEPAT